MISFAPAVSALNRATVAMAYRNVAMVPMSWAATTPYPVANSSVTTSAVFRMLGFAMAWSTAPTMVKIAPMNATVMPPNVTLTVDENSTVTICPRANAYRSRRFAMVMMIAVMAAMSRTATAPVVTIRFHARRSVNAFLFMKCAMGKPNARTVQTRKNASAIKESTRATVVSASV